MDTVHGASLKYRMAPIEDASTVELGGGAPARPASREATFARGDRLAGRYRVERFVARGGMGEVYAARDLELDTTVAIKTLRQDASLDAGARERLRREVEIARRVTHPNVCRLHDLAQHTDPDGTSHLLLTMELVDAPSLAEVLHRDGAIPPARAQALATQIAAALAAAHAVGVIHRDLKSANILVEPRTGASPRLVVTDFGLALPHGGAGAIAGTPTYMAPEAARGEKATPAVDVYAFGVVLWEMLAGAPPAERSSIAEVREAIAAPPLRAKVPGVDPRLASLVDRCLDPDPTRRPQDGMALLAALAVPRKRTRLALAAGVAAAVLAAGAIGLGMRAGSSGPVDAPATEAGRRALADARSHLRALDGAAAGASARRAIEADPRFAPAHAALSAAHRLVGDRAASIEAADAAVAAAAAGGARHHALLAEARAADAREDWASAARAYEALRALHPDEREPLADLARVYAQAARADDADRVIAASRSRFADVRAELAAALVAELRGDLTTQRAAAARALVMAEQQAAPVAAALARLELALVDASRGELAAAAAELDRAEPVLARAGACAALALSHRRRAELAWRRGELAIAEQLLDAALERSRSCGDRRGEISTTAAGALLAQARGDHAQAAARLEQSLAGYRELGDVAQVAWALQALGNLHYTGGDVHAARERWNEALAQARQLGTRDRIAEVLSNLGTLAVATGDLASGRRNLEEALATLTDIGDRSGQAHTLMSLGSLALAMDDRPEAARRFGAALALRTALGEHPRVAAAKLALAEVALGDGRVEEAQGLIDAAATALAAVAEPATELTGTLALRRVEVALARGDLVTARRERATIAPAAVDDDELALELMLCDVELALRAGDLAGARLAAEAGSRAARELGDVEAGLRARVAAARVELRRSPRGAREQLRALADEARAHGLARIARRALEAAR